MFGIRTLKKEVKKLKTSIYAQEGRARLVETTLIKHFFVVENKSMFEIAQEYGDLIVLEKEVRFSSPTTTRFYIVDNMLFAPSCHYQYTVFDKTNKRKFATNEENLSKLITEQLVKNTERVIKNTEAMIKDTETKTN